MRGWGLGDILSTMKIFKVTLGIVVFCWALLGAFWILELVNDEQFSDYGLKVTAIIFLLGVSTVAAGAVMSGSKVHVSNSESKPGPKF